MSGNLKLKNLINLTNNFQIEEVICKSCEDIIQSPVKCITCNTIYCLECAEIIKNKKYNCLNHKGFLNYEDNSSLDEMILNNITFNCKNKNLGCLYVTHSISELSFHLIDCKLFLKHCPNEGCEYEGNDLEIENHIKICFKSNVKCNICHHRFEKKEDKNKHNCIVKIVQEFNMMEENLNKERDKLDTYLKNKRSRIENIAKKLNISIMVCNICKKYTKWVANSSEIDGKGYFMCTTIKKAHNNFFRFVCQNCLLVFCTKCSKLDLTKICYCGKEMEKFSLMNQLCQNCNINICGLGWECKNCNFQICTKCLPDH